MIEVYRFLENFMYEGDKCGEVVFSVFFRRGVLFLGVRRLILLIKDFNELY